jgi:hypothetical protein
LKLASEILDSNSRRLGLWSGSGLDGSLSDGTSDGLSTRGTTNSGLLLLLLATVLHGGSNTASVGSSSSLGSSTASPATSVLSGTTSGHLGLVTRVEVHGHGKGRESSHLLLHAVEVVDVADSVGLLLPLLLAAEIFGSSFLGLMETNVRLSFGQEEVADFFGGKTFRQGSSSIVFVTESDETETGLLLGILGDPVSGSGGSDFTVLLESRLEDSFVDFGLDVLDEEVGDVLRLLVLSLQVTSSFGLTLMPADVNGLIRTVQASGVSTKVFDSLLSAFLITKADEGEVLILSGVLLDQKSFDFAVLGKSLSDQSFKFSFFTLGKVLNVDVLLGGGFGSLVLGDEGVQLELVFLELGTLEDLEASVSVFLLFELDVTVSKTDTFVVNSNSAGEDGANLTEKGVDILDSDVGVKVFNVDVGFRGEVSDVSLEHDSDVLSAKFLILSVLSGSFGITGIEEVDETETSGLSGSLISHDSYEVKRTKSGEEVVKSFFMNVFVKISDVKRRSHGELIERVEAGLTHGHVREGVRHRNVHLYLFL